MNPRYRYVPIIAFFCLMSFSWRVSPARGSLASEIIDGMKKAAATRQVAPATATPTPPAAGQAGSSRGPEAPAAAQAAAPLDQGAVSRPTEGTRAANAPLPPLLVVNGGKPGPVRGSVPMRIDAREDTEMAFVLLRVGGREDFLSNVSSVTRQWDTTSYPDGKYTVVAEAYAKHYLLRSAPIEVVIDNAGKIGSEGIAAVGVGARALAPAGLVRALPKAGRKSITVSSGARAKVLDEPLALRGGRAFVPLRRVVGAAGGRVFWQGRSRTAGAEYGKHAAAVTIGSTQARRDGRPVPLDRAPYLSARRTQMPARALAGLLDLAVEWVQGAKSVRLYPR